MNIKMLVMDVDGTLTDGHIYMSENREIMKAFDVRDGYAIANILPAHKITPVIITGRSSKIVEKRAAELNISHLYQGVSDKRRILETAKKTLGVSTDEIAYIGDDVNDLDCILCCGLTACPADAVPAVQSKVDFVCTHSGGRGAVREFIDYIVGECK